METLFHTLNIPAQNLITVEATNRKIAFGGGTAVAETARANDSHEHIDGKSQEYINEIEKLLKIIP